jgi:hypothetical protein
VSVAAHRPARVAAALLPLLLLLPAACGDAGQGVAATPASSPAATGLQASVAATELAPGLQRVPIGVLDHGAPVADAAVHVSASFASQPLSDSDAPFRGDGLQGRGLYVAHLQLAVPGLWLATVSIRRPNGDSGTVRAAFHVSATPSVPMVGQAAPRSRNPTASDVADVSTIDSGAPPDDMHQLSIAQAVEQHRPSLVVFATPAFCQTATCGPQIHAIQALEPAYRVRLAFIHVEVYQDFRPDPSRRRLSATMLEWHLQTEPWVFLIDGAGVVRAEFEASTATDELQPAIQRLLAA